MADTWTWSFSVAWVYREKRRTIIERWRYSLETAAGVSARTARAEVVALALAERERRAPCRFHIPRDARLRVRRIGGPVALAPCAEEVSDE